jgi:hypothetical protein
MGILEEQGLAITGPTPPTTAINPDNHIIDETTLAQYDSTALTDMVEPLYASKAKQLEIAAAAKRQAIQGSQLPQTQFNQPIDINQYDDAPADQGSDNVGLLLGSSVTNLLGSTADLAVDAGAYIARGANNLWEAAGGNEFYSKDEMNYALQATDFLGDTETNDKLWGYDRTAYAQGQEDVANAVHEERYWDAFTGGLKIAPELLAESIPTIASYFVGVGEVNAVKTAGMYTYKAALAKGLSKATAKRLKQDAVKQATKQLSLANKLVNSARVNAGFINSVNLQTKDNIEAYTENNNGTPPDAIDIGRMWATNFILNGLDKWAVKDILGMRKSGAMKQVWGKLDRPSKLNTTKAIASATINLAKNTGLEGAQEYAQQWGQIINENWGAKNTKQLSQVLSNPELSEEALTAFFLGTGPGAMMGAPHTAGKMLGDIHKGNKLRQKYDAITNNVDVGFATKEDQETFNTKVEQDYENAKQGFETLTKTEQRIQEVKKDSKLSDIEKVTTIQQLLNNPETSSQVTDDPANNLVREFGNEEVNNVITTVSKDEKLAPLLDSLAEDFVNDSPTELLAKLGQVLAANKDILSDEVKEAYNKANVSLQEQAASILNSSATDVTFQSAKANLNRAGDLNKVALKRSTKNGSPKSVKESVTKITDKKSTKPDWLINRILGIGKPSEAEVELRKYDNATLDQLYRETGKIINKAKKDQSTMLDDPSLNKLSKAAARMRKAPEQEKAEQLRAIIKRLKSQRKQTKATYVKPKTWQETIKDFANDKFSKLKEAADKVKSEREAKQHTTTAESTEEAPKQRTDKSNTQSKPKQKSSKNRTTSEAKAVLKTAQVMFNKIKDDVDNVKEEDIPLVQEAIDILVKSGNLGKSKADEVLHQVKAKYKRVEKQATKENAEKVRKRLIELGNNLVDDSKSKTREDIKKDIQRLKNAINSKMTKSEREFVASMLGKAVKAKTVTMEEAQKLLDKLPEGLQFDTKDFTRKKFISKTKELFNKSLQAVKEAPTKKGRQKIETKVANKVNAAKNSDLGKELTKDFTSIMSKMFSAAKKGKKELTKQYREFKDKYKDVTSLEVYENIKSTFSDLVNDKSVEEVDEIPGVNTDCK